MNPEMPQPQMPASIRTKVLVAGNLLDFDEPVDVVVVRLEEARLAGRPAEFRVDHRKVYVSPRAAEAWITAWAVAQPLSVVQEPAAVHRLNGR